MTRSVQTKKTSPPCGDLHDSPRVILQDWIPEGDPGGASGEGGWLHNSRPTLLIVHCFEHGHERPFIPSPPGVCVARLCATSKLVAWWSKFRSVILFFR